jgi:hypothetical protein
MELVLSAAVLGAEDGGHLELGEVLDGDVSLDAGGEAAAILLEVVSVGLDVSGGGGKQLSEAAAKAVVVRSDGGEGVRMIKRWAEGVLDVASLLDEARVHEGVKVLQVIDFLGEELELVDHAGLGGGELGKLGIVENLHESDLKGRHGGNAIDGDAALLPLTGNARVAVEESGDEIGFVAVKVIAGLFAGVVAEKGLGEILIDGGSETVAEHLRGDGHVEEFEPAAHGGKERGDITVRGAKRLGLKATRGSYLVFKKIAQEVEIEALHDLEDGEFPVEVYGHCGAPECA